MVIRRDRRLRWLLAAHLVLGVVASLLAPIPVRFPFRLDHIFVVPFFASVLGQAFLLALWGVGSEAPPLMRLFGLIAGAAYLEALFPRDLRREFLGIAAVTIAVTTASLLVGRAMGIRLARQADSGQPLRPEPEGLRFSIRGLMILTAAVAVLSAGARALQATPTRFLLLMAVWSTCFVAVGLAALWAALGHSRPPWRSPVVFVLSPVLGALFAFAVHAHREGWAYIILIMLLYSAALLGSLLVVRSCGFRLVRSAKPSPQNPGGEERANGSASIGGLTVRATSPE